MSEQLTTSTSAQTGYNESKNESQPELAKTVRVMEHIHASEIFSTPEHSKNFLDSLDYNEFKKWVSLVNGLERGIPTSERGKVSDSHVQSENVLMGTEVAYRPPHKEYRDKLLKEAFYKAQSLEDPKLAGLTLGLSINAIHYFADGNGRTSRLVYALLAKGYDGSQDDQKYYSSLLEETKGRQVVYPNPEVSGIDRKIRSDFFRRASRTFGYNKAFGEDLPTYVYDAYPDTFAGEYSPDKLAVADQIDDGGRLMLYQTLESGGFTMTSLMASFPPDRIKPYVRTSADGARTFVNGNEFLPTLSKDEITRWWQNSERDIYHYVGYLIHVTDRDDISEIAAHYKL